MKKIVNTESNITCSGCSHTATEIMPLDACVYLYECTNCQKLMTPDSGDCCIFCSKGSHPCPTSQRERRAYAAITPNAYNLNSAQAS